MLSTLRFYEMYQAMSLHFKDNGTYDFFKYGGKLKVTENTLLKAKGKFFYERFAKKFHNEETATQFLASNFKVGCKWVGDLQEWPYTRFVAYKESLFYMFEKDCETYRIDDPIELCFSGLTEPFEYIIITNHISAGKYFTKLNTKYADNILWEDLYNRLNKFAPFCLQYYPLDITTLVNIFKKNNTK